MARADDILDVLIVGAGITGVALGLALRQAGLRVRVLDHAPLPHFQPVAGFDQRIYAMSRASHKLLDAVGGWGRMDPARIVPIEAMAVQGDTQGQLQLTPPAGGAVPLGYIAESGAMLEGLLLTVRERAPDLIEAPVTLEAVTTQADHVAVTASRVTGASMRSGARSRTVRSRPSSMAPDSAI